MVLFRLSKFNILLQAIRTCPIGIPQREEKIFESYHKSETVPDDLLISVSVSVNLERCKEKIVDEEEPRRRRLIIADLIKQHSSRSVSFVPQLSKTYLLSEAFECFLCKKGMLIVQRPSRLGRQAVLYTKNGPVAAEVYHKQCNNVDCRASYYPCYIEFFKGDVIVRKYNRTSEKVFSITNETFFDTDLLDEFTEDIFTCTSRVHNIVSKYNRIHTGAALNYPRIFSCWLLYSVYKLTGQLEFPVLRDSHRVLDVENICRYLYEGLNKFVSEKWFPHICDGCDSRCVVLDGAAKGFSNLSYLSQ